MCLVAYITDLPSDIRFIRTSYLVGNRHTTVVGVGAFVLVYSGGGVVVHGDGRGGGVSGQNQVPAGGIHRHVVISS